MTQSKFSFSSVDDAVRLMRPGCYMAKVDIEAAYRHVPTDPNNWDSLRFVGRQMMTQTCTLMVTSNLA
jgi:hypothetical protein